MAIEFFILLYLVVIGSALGSFAAASVWRLRSRQLVEDERDGEVVNAKEYDTLMPLMKDKLMSDRSRCLHCNHVLAWYDLLPLLSWLSLRGRCRYCGVRIGNFEPLMELFVALAFAASYFFWPEPLTAPTLLIQFGLWLGALVLLAILFAYDLKWFLLPDRVVFPLIALGAFMSVLRLVSAADIVVALVSIAGAVLVLSGLYYLLWVVSKGKWIGFGDVKLGLALALLLGDWRLALIALFGANLIGSLLVMPGMLMGRIDRKAHVPFGPLLITGTFLAMLFGHQVIAWYQTAVF